MVLFSKDKEEVIEYTNTLNVEIGFLYRNLVKYLQRRY